MTDCKGLFGKLFGHDFERYLVKSPSRTYHFTSEGIDIESMKIIFENNFDIYEIRCQRCGCKTDE